MPERSSATSLSSGRSCVEASVAPRGPDARSCASAARLARTMFAWSALASRLARARVAATTALLPQPSAASLAPMNASSSAIVSVALRVRERVAPPLRNGEREALLAAEVAQGSSRRLEVAGAELEVRRTRPAAPSRPRGTRPRRYAARQQDRPTTRTGGRSSGLEPRRPRSPPRSAPVPPRASSSRWIWKRVACSNARRRYVRISPATP